MTGKKCDGSTHCGTLMMDWGGETGFEALLSVSKRGQMPQLGRVLVSRERRKGMAGVVLGMTGPKNDTGADSYRPRGHCNSFVNLVGRDREQSLSRFTRLGPSLSVHTSVGRTRFSRDQPSKKLLLALLRDLLLRGLLLGFLRHGPDSFFVAPSACLHNTYSRDMMCIGINLDTS